MIDEPMRKIIRAVFELHLERRTEREGPEQALRSLTADYKRVRDNGKTLAARVQAGEAYRMAQATTEAATT